MLSSASDRIVGLVLKYRKTVLSLLLAITVFAAVQLPKGHFENALEVWFVKDDPALRDHRDMIDAFSSDELIVIGLDAPDVFTPEILDMVDRLTAQLEAAPHVEKVYSLTNIEGITGRDDTIEIADLVQFPLDVDALPALRAKALANDLYVGNVVSREGDFTAIVVRLPYIVGDFDYKVEAVGAIREILVGYPGFDLYLSGGPALDDEFYRLSTADSARTTTLMLLLLVATLWLLLRSIAGVVLPFIAVVVATVWALAWIVLSGGQFTAVTLMMPPVLLAVGVASSMHVLVEYRKRFLTGTENVEAVLKDVARHLTLPLVLCAGTTAVGMLALTVSKVQGIRDFGFFSALGVLGALVISLTLVPVCLTYLPAPRPFTERRQRQERRLAKMHELTMRYRRAIVAGFAALAVAGVAGATFIRAESDFMEMFPPDNPIKLATERFEKKLSGTVTLDVVIDTGRPDGIKDPALLRRIDALEQFLMSQHIVGATQSIADYMKDLRRAFFGNDQREYRLPDTQEEAAQYLLLYEMDAPDGDLRDYATFDYSKTRVTARVKLESSNDAIRLVNDTEAWANANFPSNETITVTGITQLYANMEVYIRESMIRGFSIALCAIFVVMCLQLRSIVLGAMAMIPNVFPIVLTLGIMGFSGIRLDSMTTMVASISIGLAVDDTIHFINRVREHLARGTGMVAALRESTIEVGRALVFTSLSLGAGFGTLMTADFVGTYYFGLLCLLTIVFALAADLILLPVVLRWHAEHLARVRVGEPRVATVAEKRG
jgi:predicted RND superfamily exporter protein